MNRNLLIFVFLTFLLILPTSTKSFAQNSSSNEDDSALDEQARQEQTQQTLNQIHDLAVKMQENAKRLDALERAVNSTGEEASAAETPEQAVSNQEVPIEQAPIQEVPAPAVAPVQEPVVEAAAPVQTVPIETSPEEQSIAEIKAEPVDVLPQAPIYYAPLTDFPKEHTFEISQEDFYSSFKESGSNNFNSGKFNGVVYDHKETGGFYGLYSAYSYRPLDTETWPVNVYHVDVHGDFGYDDYNYGDGAKLRGIDNYIVEPQIWIGKDLNFLYYDRLTPYVGVGYRWDYEQLKNKIYQIDEVDDILLKSNNLENQYLYIPMGAQLSLRPAEGWRVDLNSEYDFLVWGRVTEYPIVFTNGYSNIESSDINNTLRGGYGLRDSIKIVKEGVSFNYFIEPYFEYWNIRPSKTSYLSIDGDTDTSDPIRQDKNTTTEIGARAGVEF